MPKYRETYSKNYTNAAAIAAGAYAVYEDRENAKKNNNLPHNSLIIANQSSSVTCFVFLDDFTDQTKPDYVLFPSQQLTVPVEDGIHFSHLFVKNTHGADDVAIAELKVRVSTVQEV